VTLTHENFRANLNQSRKRFGPRPDKQDGQSIDETSRVVSYLPLAHVLERLAGHFLMFASGAHVCYAESPDTLQEDFGLVQPTSGTSVPRVYEKLFDAVREQATESPTKERIFEWAVDVWPRVLRGRRPRPRAPREARRRGQTRLREGAGRPRRQRGVLHLRRWLALSGALRALPRHRPPHPGGYGLTETSPVVSVNPAEEPKVGTIGPPVPGTDLELDESVASPEQQERTAGRAGELLVRGPQVFDGYWELPEATEEAFVERDGQEWFRTGDVVEIREDGYVRFLERAKQLLTLSTGKNVAPGPIEDAFAASPLVEQAMVVGDEQKFVSAIVVPNFDGVRRWAHNEDVDVPADDAELCRDDRVKARIQEEVDHVNEQFERYEQIKQFRLVPTEFTEDNEMLTPTMKKKRRNILDAFADQIGDMYE